MKKAIMTAILIGSLSSPALAEPTDLYGTWKLINFQRKIVETGQVEEVFGRSPTGFLNYGPDGRMIVIIVRDQRTKPASLQDLTDPLRAELFKGLIAYAGTYTFDGKSVTHHIDASWNEVWTGTDQTRDVTIQGDRILLTTRPAPSSMDGKPSVGILTWQKLK